MFDPYHKWLGIPPKDQPPNHYRLLGIEIFEADADVIDAAANRQMAYVQSCASGPHLELSQKLLNEIAAARVGLLDATKKSAYDTELKAKERRKQERRQEQRRKDVVPVELENRGSGERRAHERRGQAELPDPNRSGVKGRDNPKSPIMVQSEKNARSPAPNGQHSLQGLPVESSPHVRLKTATGVKVLVLSSVLLLGGVGIYFLMGLQGGKSQPEPDSTGIADATKPTKPNDPETPNGESQPPTLEPADPKTSTEEIPLPDPATRPVVESPEPTIPTSPFRPAEPTIPTNPSRPSMEPAPPTTPDPKKDNWQVVFHSSDPSIWNQNVKDQRGFAVETKSLAEDIRFLKLARTESQFVIVKIYKGILRRAWDDGKVGFQGLNTFNWQAHQLGIYVKDWNEQSKGKINVLALGGRGFSGWGFGVRIYVNDKQGFVWGGSEIPPTKFEISVKSGDLTADEQKWLLTKDTIKPAPTELSANDFDALDRNADGEWTKDELIGTVYESLFAQMDVNKDGKTDRKGFESFLKQHAKFELVVEASIDGDTELHITKAGIFWKVGNTEKPGNLTLPTYVNNKSWMPVWGKPKEARGPDQSKPLAVAIGILDLKLEVLAVTEKRGGKGMDKRDPVTLRTEGETQIVSIPDGQVGGHWYKLRLHRSKLRVEGRWQHSIKGGATFEMRLLANGIVNDDKSPHSWSVKDDKLLLKWANKDAPGGYWTDTCVLSKDGKTYSGKNQQGAEVTGKKLGD